MYNHYKFLWLFFVVPIPKRANLTQKVYTPAVPSENVTRFALLDVCVWGFQDGVGSAWKNGNQWVWGSRNKEKLGWQWGLGAAFWHLSATTRAARRTME